MQDAEDAAQSALISFWKSACQDDLTRVVDRNSLWRLLTVITVRKARRVVRNEFAEKRGGGKVRRYTDVDLAHSGGIESILGDVAAEDFDLVCEECLESLPDDLREFAVLRLFGHTVAEMSEIADCSQRRVERKLARIRELLRADGDQAVFSR